MEKPLNFFDGLWQTNHGSFVLVENRIGRVAHPNGKLSHYTFEVDDDGQCDTYGKLMVKQRSDGPFLNEEQKSIQWPVIVRTK